MEPPAPPPAGAWQPLDPEQDALLLGLDQELSRAGPADEAILDELLGGEEDRGEAEES